MCLGIAQLEVFTWYSIGPVFEFALFPPVTFTYTINMTDALPGGFGNGEQGHRQCWGTGNIENQDFDLGEHRTEAWYVLFVRLHSISWNLQEKCLLAVEPIRMVFGDNLKTRGL